MSESGPLSPEQTEALAAALRRKARIGAAERVAAVDGWALLVVGGLSVLVGLLNPGGLVGGLALVALGWNELRGRELLRKLDPRGGRVLGWNQIGLMGLIAAYCLWSMYGALAHPRAELAELEELVGISQELVAQATVLFYGLVIALSALLQGLLARFYFVRGRMVEEQLSQTPGWVLEVLRGMAGS